MAGQVNFLLRITGDSSKAVAAVGRLGGQLNRLGSDLKSTAKSASSLQKTVSTAASAYGTMLKSSTSSAGLLSNLNKAVNSAGFTNFAAKTKAAFETAKASANSFYTTVQSKAAPVTTAATSAMEAGIKKVRTAWNMAVVSVAKYGATAIIAKNVLSKSISIPSLGAIPSFGNLISSAKSLGGSIRSSIVPAISSMSSALGKASADMGRLFASAARGMGALAAGMARSFGSGLANRLSGLPNIVGRATGALDNLRKQMLNVNDLFRFAAQGITNFGRSMMFFVSLPIAGFLGGVLKTAIDFEDALLRVAKTANLDKAALGELTQSIRGLAVNTATSHTELAQIAAVIGQMGVEVPNSIAAITDTVNLFAIATDQAGEEVATALGRIANAFGWNLNESTEEVTRLANVINLLENKTASNAQEIQNAVADFAPFANMLNITAADAAGLAATLVSLGLSSDEAGTALRNMAVNLPRHAEKLSEMMSGIAPGFESAEAVIERLETDAVGVFVDLTRAAANGNSEVAALLGLMEVADLRGGRGLAALAGNTEMLAQNLAYANKEWKESTSLLAEYTMAMSSTKNQLAILRNNINDVGITVGEAILPPLNDIIKVAVPALRMLGDWFKNLDKSTQMQILAFTALGLAAGPILMFLGQMLHAVTLVVLGFGQMGKVVIVAINALVKLGPALLGIGKFLAAWPVLIIAAAVGVLKILSKMGLDIAGFFRDLGSKARTWGENLAGNIANGLIAGAVRLITRAVQYIADIIASFFESHSPPKKGPLSTIDKWGIALMNTFLNGFKLADFSILRDISKIIETELTRGLEGDALVGALRKVAGARTKLSQLISEYNQSGTVNKGLLNEITSGLGPMTDKVQKLVTLYLEYNRLQERLASIEGRRKGVIKGYEAELKAIAASNMSIEEKIEATLAAQRARDDSLDALDEEEEGLQEQADLVKAQLDYQKELIDSLQDQEDLFQRIADTLKQIAEEKKNAADNGGAGGAEDGGLGSFEGAEGIGNAPDLDLSGLDSAKEKLSGLGSDFQAAIDRFAEGKGALQGFIDAWNGLPRKSDLPDGIQGLYDVMYNLGRKAAEVRDKTLTFIDTLSGIKEKITTIFKGQDGDLGINIELPPGLQKIKDWVDQNWPLIQAAFQTGWIIIQDIFKAAGETIAKTFEELRPSFEAIKERMGPLKQAFSELWIALQPLAPVVGVVAAALGGVLLLAIGIVIGVINGLIAGLTMLVQGFVSVLTGVVNFATGIINTITGMFDIVVGLFTLNGEKIKEGMEKVQLGAQQIWEGIKNTIIGLVEGLFGSLFEFFAVGIARIIEFFQNLYNELVGHSIIPDMMTAIYDAVVNGMNLVIEFFRSKVEEWAAAAKDLVTGFIDGIKSGLETAIAVIQEVAQQVLDTFKNILGISSPSTVFYQFGVDLMQGLVDGIQSMVTMVQNILSNLGSTIINSISNWLTGGGSTSTGQGGSSDNPGSFLPNIQQVQDNLTQMNSAVDNATNLMTTNFALAGQSMANTWSQALTQMTNQANTGGLTSFVTTLQSTFSAMVAQIGNQWATTLAGIQGETQTATDGVEDAFTDLSTTVEEGTDQNKLSVEELNETWKSVRESIEKANASLRVFIQTDTTISTRKLNLLADGWQDVTSQLSKAVNAMANFKNLLAGLKTQSIVIDISQAVSNTGLAASGSLTDTTWEGSGYLYAKASGGSVADGNAYRVGELGEELFIPNQGGTIVPNYLLERLFKAPVGSSGPAEIHVHLHDPVVRDDVDIRRTARLVAEELAKLVNQQSSLGAFSGF